MKLKIKERTAVKKSESKKLRREGFIPAVLYVRGKEGRTISVENHAFAGYLRQIKSGHLPTTQFTLVDDKGVEHRVLIKDIQYDIVTYAVKHLDFEELVEDFNINVKVPIECVGQAECPGIKLGGVLRQVIRHVRVRCLPKDLPAYFELSLEGLNLRQTKRLSDIQMPETVRPLVDLKEVVAVIVKR